MRYALQRNVAVTLATSVVFLERSHPFLSFFKTCDLTDEWQSVVTLTQRARFPLPGHDNPAQTEDRPAALKAPGGLTVRLGCMAGLSAASCRCHDCNCADRKKNKKGNHMSTSKNKPIYRVSFSSPTTDKDGNAKLSQAAEIGAVFERKNGKQGAILRLKVVPANIAEGVIFLTPVKSQDRGFA
jgi:hypothetical protein